MDERSNMGYKAMRTLTVKEFIAELKAQGVSKNNLCFVCPVCGTVQSAKDLIKAKAGKTFKDVEKYLGFSCVGRFIHMKPAPKEKGTQFGCDWTLGGLFQLHKLEVVDEDGVKHPRFEIATPEQAKEHCNAKAQA
jgi:hypothetical protein